MATHSGESPRTEEPGRLQTMGRKELDMTKHSIAQPGVV